MAGWNSGADASTWQPVYDCEGLSGFSLFLCDTYSGLLDVVTEQGFLLAGAVVGIVLSVALLKSRGGGRRPPGMPGSHRGGPRAPRRPRGPAAPRSHG